MACPRWKIRTGWICAIQRLIWEEVQSALLERPGRRSRGGDALSIGGLNVAPSLARRSSPSMAVIKQVKFYGRQSSMAPNKDEAEAEAEAEDGMEDMSEVIQLLSCSSKGDVAGLRSLLDKGVNVNISDLDQRTALHVAACEGQKEAVQVLLDRGADVNARDRWGSTPLADAGHYGCKDVALILEQHGGMLPNISPMQVSQPFDVPDYEISPAELIIPGGAKDSVRAKWRGTTVFVKMVPLDPPEKVEAFVSELSLLVKLRHPNIVQFLGAVTQSIPVMLVTEFLQKGDLKTYLEMRGKPVKPRVCLRFAFDIARGMNYVHSLKPEPAMHSNLKPSNLLRDKAKHLKITDFAFIKSPEELQHLIETSGRYMAPELFLGQEYGPKVDVFSFALIVQEMMEGTCPFPKLSPEAAARGYAEGSRPPFKVKQRYYPEGLKELIEICWDKEPAKRPTFSEIINKLEEIKSNYFSSSFKCFIAHVRYSPLCGR